LENSNEKKDEIGQNSNPDTERINSIKTHKGPINNSELEESTYEEINEITKNMKSNKAADPSEILL